MNNIWILIIPFFIISCQCNPSIKKDKKTGAYSETLGIACKDIEIQKNKKTDPSNEFIYGEEVAIVFKQVTGFINVENKIYPGLSFYIVKNSIDTVLSNKDILSKMSYGANHSPLNLKANFKAFLPYNNNERFKAFVTIWDKKGEGSFNYELPFTIKENHLLTIKSKDITYSNVFLFNETLKLPVYDSNLNQKHAFTLLLDDLKGLDFNTTDLDFTIVINDRNGNDIIEKQTMKNNFKIETKNEQNIKRQQLVRFSIIQEGIENPCKLTAVLKDKNSSKELNITTQLSVNK